MVNTKFLLVRLQRKRHLEDCIARRGLEQEKHVVTPKLHVVDTRSRDKEEKMSASRLVHWMKGFNLFSTRKLSKP